jgi:hypothetical protein
MKRNAIHVITMLDFFRSLLCSPEKSVALQRQRRPSGSVKRLQIQYFWIVLIKTNKKPNLKSCRRRWPMYRTRIRQEPLPHIPDVRINCNSSVKKFIKATLLQYRSLQRDVLSISKGSDKIKRRRYIFKFCNISNTFCVYHHIILAIHHFCLNRSFCTSYFHFQLKLWNSLFRTFFVYK